MQDSLFDKISKKTFLRTEPNTGTVELRQMKMLFDILKLNEEYKNNSS